MLSPDQPQRMPALEFCSPEWLAILKDLDMVSRITDEIAPDVAAAIGQYASASALTTVPHAIAVAAAAFVVCLWIGEPTNPHTDVGPGQR